MQGGIEAMYHGRVDQAEHLLVRAVETRPKDPRIREHLATVYAQQGDFNAAIQQMSKSIELSDGDPSLNVQLGKYYLANGGWLPAARQAALALDYNRKMPEAWALRGETKLAKGELNEALADFQRALSYQPDMPEVQLKVATIQRRLGRPMRALSTLENMLSHYPIDQQPENAVLLAGDVLIEIKQFDQAIELLSQTTSQRGASPDSFLLLSRAQLAAGQPSQARLTLVRAGSEYPHQPQIQSMLSELQPTDQRVALVDAESRVIR